jgi:acyl-CoA thioesterase FadM
VFFDYKSALTYPDTVIVGSRLTAVSSGNDPSAAADRFHLIHRLVSVKTGQVVGECEGVIVCVDYANGGRKAPLPPLILAALQQLQRDQEARALAEGGVNKPPRCSTSFERV